MSVLGRKGGKTGGRPKTYADRKLVTVKFLPETLERLKHGADAKTGANLTLLINEICEEWLENNGY